MAKSLTVLTFGGNSKELHVGVEKFTNNGLGIVVIIVSYIMKLIKAVNKAVSNKGWEELEGTVTGTNEN